MNGLAIKLKCRNCGVINDLNIDLGEIPLDMTHSLHPAWARRVGMMCSGNYDVANSNNSFSIPHTCKCIPDSVVIHDIISYKII